MRLTCGFLLLLVACGPAVEPEEMSMDSMGSTGSMNSTGSMDTEGVTAGTTVAPDPTDGDGSSTFVPDPIDETGSTTDPGPIGTVIEGEYYFALPAIIAQDTPFQFVGTLRADELGISLLLTPLSLDPGSVDTPREEVPPPIELVGIVSAEGQYTIEVPNIELPGSTNPVTGSDLVAQMTIVGAFEGDRFCARVSGMVTVPVNIDLTGSTFEAMPRPVNGGLPLPNEIGCPP